MLSLRSLAAACLVGSIAAFAAALESSAQSKTNITGTGGIHQIRGKVYLPSGRPLDSQLEVELQSTTYASLKVITDVSGAFAFENLAPGAYTLVIKASDQFDEARESVLIDAEVQGSVRLPPRTKIFTVPLYLQLKRNTGPAQISGVIDAKWSEIPKAAIHDLERGLAAVVDRKLDKAEAEFRKAIETAPTFAPAYAALGKLYLMQARVEDAITNLHLAIRYDPSDFDSRLSLGIAFLNHNEFAGAKRELSEAVALNKTAVTPRYYLGLVYVQMKDIDSAQKEFEAAKQMIGDNSFPLLHRYLGGVYVAKQMNKEAVAELETYIAQDPKAKDSDRIKQTIADLKAKID